MKFLRILALLLIANIATAEARVLRGSAPAVGPNSALSGIVGFDSTMFPFVNFLKEAVSFQGQSATTFIYPNNLLASTNLPSGSISTRMGFSTPLPSTVYSGHYVFAVQGTVGGNGVLFASNGSTNQPGTVYSKTAGTTLSGCTNANIPPCTFTALNITGTNPQIEFDNSPVVASFLINWAAGSTFSGMLSAVLCKVADFNVDSTCNTDTRRAWAGGFNDDFIAFLATAHEAHIRYLDVNNTLFSLGDSMAPADFANWQTTSAWSYNLQHDWWAIPNWFGSSSGTNTYAITCSNGQACTYTLTGGAPKDGDFVQFYVAAGTANTNNSPTLQITDAGATTSAAFPIFDIFATQRKAYFSGTPTVGDAVSLTFTTTPLGAYTCLAGGAHTTSAYTVIGGDTIGSISTALYNIVNADATLTAQPFAGTFRNPNGGTGSTGNFQIGYASNACALTVTANITGAATEVFALGWQGIGSINEKTLYSAVYNSYLGGFVLGGTGGAGSSWPWIVQIQLAQAVSIKSGVKVGCWLQTNLLWSTASFTSLANLAAANQCPNGSKFELGNEIWNQFRPPWVQELYLGASLGLQGNSGKYYTLRQRQLWEIASTAFGGIAGNLHTISAWQEGGGLSVATYYSGASLCGTGGGCATQNQAYQNAIGVNYNVGPNRPQDFIRHLSEAPYFHGGVLNSSYFSAASYGTWSATSSSVASNVLTVGGTVTNTIWWNQGLTGCDGTYIAASNLNNPTTAQLTGTVTTTLNGAVTQNQHNWTVTSTAGLSAGMWVWNATTGVVNATIVAVVDGTHLTVGAGSGIGKTYQSAGVNDTLVFGGQAGTYRLNSTSCSIPGGSTVTGGDVLGLQYAADNYCTASSLCTTGNPGLGSVQDAFNWAYVDLVAGVVKNQTDLGGNSAGSFSSLVGGAFMPLAANAVSMGIDVQDYEGGPDGVPPCGNPGGCPNSVGYQTANMGLANGYGFTNVNYSDGWIAQMQIAFKNSSTYQDVITYAHNQELSFLPVGSMTQKYVFSANARWSILNPPGSLFAVPYKEYNAFCAYNGNPC